MRSITYLIALSLFFSSNTSMAFDEERLNEMNTFNLLSPQCNSANISPQACHASDYKYNENLPNGPESLIEQRIFKPKGRTKYSINLTWKPIANANIYKIELSRLNSKQKKYYITRSNYFNIEVFAYKDYIWRVVAFDETIQLTNYTKNKYLVVITDSPSSAESDNLVTNNKSEGNKTFDEIVDVTEKVVHVTDEIVDITNEGDDKSKLNTSSSIHLWTNYWLKVGLGMRLTKYDQDIDSLNSGSQSNSRLYHATNGKPSFNLNAGKFFGPSLAVEVDYNISKGSFLEVNNLLFTDYIWSELMIEGLYLFNSAGTKTDENFYLRFGALLQSISALASFPAPTLTYEIVDNNLIFLSLGAGYTKKFEEKVKANVFINLLYHLFSSTSKFDYSADSGIGLKSLLTAEYQLKPKHNIGVSWQFHYLNISYNLSNPSFNTAGTQSLIQNTFGLFYRYETNAF